MGMAAEAVRPGSSVATPAAEARLLRTAQNRGADVGDLVKWTEERRSMAGRLVDAYRQYWWDVTSVDDLRLAPFQVLAGGGRPTPKVARDLSGVRFPSVLL